jgi:hypothetical protein
MGDRLVFIPCRLDRRDARSALIEDADGWPRKVVEPPRGLVADYPGRHRDRQESTAISVEQDMLLKDMGRAEPAYADAVTADRQFVRWSPDESAWRHDLAAAHHKPGDLLSDLKWPKQAEAEYTEALAIYKKLADGFPNRPNFHQNLAPLQRPRHSARRVAPDEGGGRRLHRAPGHLPEASRRVPE